MISLYEHQELGVSNLRASILKYKRSILVGSTGVGKTRIATRIIQGAVQNKKRVWFVVHRRELCKQTSEALWSAKVEHGQIMSGKTRSPSLVQVCTVITAANRIKKLPEDQRPDIIIFDECHRSISSSYETIVEHCTNAYIIGLTATPQRTDAKGLGHLYSDIVEIESMAWLIAHGFLSKYRLIAPTEAPDLSQVKMKGGDYDETQLAAVMDKPQITGDAIKAYKQFANGKRCMVFCVSIKHSKHTCAEYNNAGIRAEHIDGEHTDAQRDAALQRFRKGETLVLCSVQLAIEGLDIPAVQVVQQLRPTQSIIVYLQAIGRGLRTEEGKKELIILDQVNNWKRHGLPDDDREWSLEDRPKKKRGKRDEEPDLKVEQCKKCYAVFKKGVRECPNCGAKIETHGRMIKQVDGELSEIDIKRARQQRTFKQSQARTLSELVALGIERKMKNPSAWAAMIFCQRKGRRPTPSEFKEAKQIYLELQSSQANYSGAF
jgi:superfamily II DNA or RNA helicase